MKYPLLNDTLYKYALDVSLREHPVLTKLREETSKHALATMQISPDEGQFLQFLVRILNAEKILEIGTFTGYSALSMALALPQDGKLITCDLNPEWTQNAPLFWKEAEVSDKIELRLGKALDTMETLLKTGHQGTFDFIFIDADKTNYISYYELSLKLLKSNGVIAIDNIFWDGNVVDPNDESAQTREIRRLNEHIKKDLNVHVSLLTIADGLFLIQKKN